MPHNASGVINELKLVLGQLTTAVKSKIVRSKSQMIIKKSNIEKKSPQCYHFGLKEVVLWC